MGTWQLLLPRYSQAHRAKRKSETYWQLTEMQHLGSAERSFLAVQMRENRNPPQTESLPNSLTAVTHLIHQIVCIELFRCSFKGWLGILKALSRKVCQKLHETNWFDASAIAPWAAQMRFKEGLAFLPTLLSVLSPFVEGV